MENTQPKIEYNFPDLAYAPAPVSARTASVNNALSHRMNGISDNQGPTNKELYDGYYGTPITETKQEDKLAWMNHPLFRMAQLASVAACAYHGYKRNNSVGWALWWGFWGGGVITPAIAIAQGFGKPINKK